MLIFVIVHKIVAVTVIPYQRLTKTKQKKKTTQTFRKLRTILILWKLILRVIFIHKSSAVVVKYGEVVLSQNKLIRVSAENADALNKKKKIRPQKPALLVRYLSSLGPYPQSLGHDHKATPTKASSLLEPQKTNFSIDG